MSFNQGAPGVSQIINASNVFVYGNTSTGNALSVQQLGAGNVFVTSNTNGTIGLFVAPSSNVGIGTTNPLGPIHSYTTRLGLPDSSGSGTSNVVARIQSGSICLDFGSVGGTNPFWIQNHLNTAWNTTYPLLLNPNGGNVGISTTSPSGLLQVHCDDIWQGGITLGSKATTAATSGEFMIQRGPSNAIFGSGGLSNAMVFHTTNELTASGNVGFLFMSSNSRIGMFYDTRNSRLGIGVTNPTFTLQVNGSIGSAVGSSIPITLPPVGSFISYGITLAASGTWYTIISDARINATITGAIGTSDLTSTIFIATLYANGGASASMTLVTGSATNIRVSGTALQFNAVSGLYGLSCNFTILRHN